MIAHDNEYVTTAQISEWIKQNQLDLYQTIEPHNWTYRLRDVISDNLKIFETFSTSSKPKKYRLKQAILKGEVEPEGSNSASSTDGQPSSKVTIAKRRKDKNFRQELEIKSLIKQQQHDFSVTVTAKKDSLFIAIQCVLHAMIAHDNEYVTIAQISEWIKHNQPDLYVKKQPRSWNNELNIAISDNLIIFETFSTSSKPRRYRLKQAILKGEVEPEGSNSASSTDGQPLSKVTIANCRKGKNVRQKLEINAFIKKQQYDFSVTVTARSDSLFVAIQCVLNAIIAHDNECITIPQIRQWMIENQRILFAEKKSNRWDEHLRNAISDNPEIIETSTPSSGLREYRLKQAILTEGVEAWKFKQAINSTSLPRNGKHNSLIMMIY